MDSLVCFIPIFVETLTSIKNPVSLYPLQVTHATLLSVPMADHPLAVSASALVDTRVPIARKVSDSIPRTWEYVNDSFTVTSPNPTSTTKTTTLASEFKLRNLCWGGQKYLERWSDWEKHIHDHEKTVKFQQQLLRQQRRLRPRLPLPFPLRVQNFFLLGYIEFAFSQDGSCLLSRCDNV